MDYNDADDLRKYQADAAEDAERAAEFAATYPNGNLASVATSADERCPAETDGYRCAYPVGHPELTIDGNAFAHSVPNLVSWNPERVTIPDDERCLGIAARGDDSVPCALRAGHAAACVDPDGRPLLDDPAPAEPQPRCESRPEPYGWATRDTRCVGTAGHDGPHGDGNGVEWTVGTTEADASRWIDAFFDGVPAAPRLRLTALNPQPVRVRFVDLPHRHGEREVDGIPVGTIEPGGFALVVDRFKHLAHLEAERGMWTAWADLIGARTVLCYPGELEIVDYLSE